MDELKGVLDDTARHQLLSAVSAVLHEGACQSLDDGALYRLRQEITHTV